MAQIIFLLIYGQTENLVCILGLRYKELKITPVLIICVLPMVYCRYLFSVK